MSKLIDDVEKNIKRYRDIINARTTPLEDNEVEKLNHLNKALRATIATIKEPLTANAMIDSLVTFNKITPEFRMAFSSMFDNLMKDPVRYFFGKYEGTIVVTINDIDVRLNYQYERKLYSMCYKESKIVSDSDRYILFSKALGILNDIRKALLLEILRIVTGDVRDRMKLLDKLDVPVNDQLEIYDDLYQRVNAFKVLSQLVKHTFFNQDVVIARSKVITDNIELYKEEILKKQLEIAKKDIAKLFYEHVDANEEPNKIKHKFGLQDFVEFAIYNKLSK
jgi:hypothetical protein